MSLIKCIRSGAQSGVDRAALDSARKNGIDICGFVACRGNCEDLGDGELFDKYPELTDCGSGDLNIRTKMNVKYSDVTIIFAPAINCDCEGTKFTYKMVRQFNKPHLFIEEAQDFADKRGLVDEIHKFLCSVGRDELDVNIAGYRESKCSGIYSDVFGILDSYFNKYGRD